MSTISVRPFAALVLAAALTACGGGGEPSPDSPAGRLTGGGSAVGGDDSGGSGDGAVRIGSGTGSSFTAGALAATTSDLDAGDSTTITVNLVDGNNSAISQELAVTFASDCQANGLASFSETSVTTAAGRATTEYTAEGCSGTDEVTASVEVEGKTLRATVQLTIEADAVLSVQYDSTVSDQLALAGIGGNETTRVYFKLVGAQGAPIRGESVSFSLSTTVGGLRISEGKQTAVSDNNGLVNTVLQSGTVATTVRVTATHDATGKKGVSENITVSTGVPVDSHFSISLTQYNIANAHDMDGVEVEVAVIASDQYGNDALDGTRISFWSPESGNIDSSCILESGRCSATWISSDPRPDDGRLTLIAYTTGAEDFSDSNGNNVYDTNDAGWVDLGEPCIDENEDGVCNPGGGEFFVDENENKVLDSGDGVWNGPCMSAVDPSALCPGSDSVIIARTRTIILSLHKARIWEWGDFPSSGTIDLRDHDGDGINDGAAQSRVLDGLILADTNINADDLGGNPLPAGTSITFEATNGEIINTAEWTVGNANGPTGPYMVMLAPDDESDVGLLKLKVEIEGDVTEFFWNLHD